ncbi:MAG: RiPP maturation radical SAM C-methyltransferase [Desulfobacterales bacterium]|jgi:ribosomal peptide maturation radical SAM protein 1
MKHKSNRTFDKIALISTPWPLYSRPSIQLGTLKAFLQTRISHLQIDVFHFYLSLAQTIGYRLYHEISERTWLAESVYAALLYPQRFKKAADLFRKESAGNSILRSIRFSELTTRVKKTTDAFLNRQNWGTFGLLGFSISFCQLTSALFVIKCIKKKFPNLIIVVGGASTSGQAAQGFLKGFPEIDVVVRGEGEMPLYQIIEHLRKAPHDLDLTKIKGVVSRSTDVENIGQSASLQMDTLNDLPAPDYDAYFDLLKTFNARETFFPILPVEISRGCWWKRTAGSGKLSGCAFCNLNLQWHGYRHKPPSQVVSEIDQLTGRYQTLSVAITDNVLPRKGSVEIFKQIGKLNKDLRFFGEVRATTPWMELQVMRDCGMQKVQIGIEALSSRLLKKLHKGTNAIQNLEIMKNCEALRIENISNLILQFPGSDMQDVTETLKVIEFAMPFYPLKAVNFWLGMGSPVWQNPKKFGVKAVFNHPNWSDLFPEEICRTLSFMIQAYRGDLTYQKKIWKPVKKKISEWQKQYTAIHNGPGHLPILSFQDGRDFIIIRQRRFQAEPATHRLVGASRSIYLFCQKQRSFETILTKFSRIPDDRILKFLKMMVAKKLMFAEENKYLSLAVPIS